ncbi:UNVERIFIED_CONTAM: hypothetical protein FKN15_021911 [Acipenser sinensis]
MGEDTEEWFRRKARKPGPDRLSLPLCPLCEGKHYFAICPFCSYEEELAPEWEEPVHPAPRRADRERPVPRRRDRERPAPRQGNRGNPKPERQLFPPPPAEGKCLLSPSQPAEEECLLVSPSQPAEEECLLVSPSKDEPHQSPTIGGAPHQSPAIGGELHQSPAIGGDYTLLPPSSPGDYTLLPPSLAGAEQPLPLPPSPAGAEQQELSLPLHHQKQSSRS